MNILRLVAVLALRKGAMAALGRGDTVLAKLTGSTLITNPNPALPIFEAHLNTLRETQAAKDTGPAAVEARDVALRQVRRDLENLRISAQQAADANQEHAALVIESAGMYVKKAPARTKADFAIRQGAASGLATAQVRSRGRGATYWWVYSVDQRSWATTPATRTATTGFANLTPGTTYYFRFQVLTPAGLGDWSQIISFMVK
jgi:hypothetical protein